MKHNFVDEDPARPPYLGRPCNLRYVARVWRRTDGQRNRRRSLVHH